MKRFLRSILWASVALAAFLAFAWPALVSPEPGSVTFEVLAKATLAAFFIALAGLLLLKARGPGAR